MTMTQHLSQPPGQADPPPPPRTRLLALDLGEKRVGVAVSDELAMYAHARPALAFSTTAALIADVARLVETDSVAEVIVGLPLSLTGQRGPQAERLKPIVRALRSGLPVPVREWDERFSSKQAARHVKGRERQRSGELDSASAAILLQAVLDSRRERQQ